VKYSKVFVITRFIGLVVLAIGMNVGDVVLGDGYSPDKHTTLLLHFDEGKGDPGDSSSSENHGTNNGATWTTAGRFGSAMKFYGTDSYVDCGNSTDLDVGTGDQLRRGLNGKVIYLSGGERYAGNMEEEDGIFM